MYHMPVRSAWQTFTPWLSILLVCSLFLFSLTAYSKTLYVGIAPSTPEPAREGLEGVDTDSFEDKIRRGLKVKEKDNKNYKTKKSAEPETDSTPEVLPTKQEAWKDVFNYLSKETGLKFAFVNAASQLEFELGLSKGAYDFAYITPLQFVAFSDHPGYKPIVKRKAQPLRGMIFVSHYSKYQSLKELEGAEIVFPPPLDFPGSVAIRSSLNKLDFDFSAKFMPNHEQTYSQVTIGNFEAGGATRETYRALPYEIRKLLRIIWDSPGYSPYPFVAHPRVPFFTITRLQRAMVNMSKNPEMKETLQHLFIDNGFEVARERDYHEITLIDLEKLNGSPNKVEAREPMPGDRIN